MTKGRYGEFGGQYVPETLMNAVNELEEAYNKYSNDPEFIKELNDLGFKMLIGVHDELIGECPKENADRVAERLTTIMKTCIQDYCNVPFSCDASIAEHWYEEEYDSSIKKEYKTLESKYDNPFEELCRLHTESNENYLRNVINN